MGLEAGTWTEFLSGAGAFVAAGVALWIAIDTRRTLIRARQAEALLELGDLVSQHLDQVEEELKVPGRRPIDPMSAVDWLNEFAPIPRRVRMLCAVVSDVGEAQMPIVWEMYAKNQWSHPDPMRRNSIEGEIDGALRSLT